MTENNTQPPSDSGPSQDAYNQMLLKTWKYLRFAMIALPIGLGVCIIWEYTKTPGNHCLQGSISAYYYTPVSGFLVGTMVAIGLCLYALRGNTDKEDVLLNIAGMFAPIIGLVPTPGPGNCSSDTSSRTLVGLGQKDPVVVQVRTLVVDNNMRALLVIILIGLLFLAWQFFSNRENWKLRKGNEPRWFGIARFLGYFSTFVAYAFIAVSFYTQPDWFRDHMHYISAAVMFVAIFIVVCINAARSAGLFTWIYRGIAIGMLGTAILFGLHSNFHVSWLLSPWKHWLLWLEISQISGFAIFWTMQTIHGRKGLVGHGQLVDTPKAVLVV